MGNGHDLGLTERMDLEMAIEKDPSKIEKKIRERIGFLKVTFSDSVRKGIKNLVKSDIISLYYLGKSQEAEQYARMYHNYTDEQIEFAPRKK